MNRRKSHRVCAGFYLVLMAVLSACGASTSDSTSVAGSVVLTPTIAPTATNTPVPTATLIPNILEIMPSEISDDNLSITGGNFQFQITDVSGLRQIGEQIAPSNSVFLVLHGHLYNYSDQEREFHDVDFQIDYSTESNLNPDVGLMSMLQQASYPQARYPDCNILRCKDFILPAKKAQEIILVYTVPTALDHFTLNFAPTGTSAH